MSRNRPGRSTQKGAPAGQQQQSNQQVVQVTEQFSGPLPHPDVLERYNQVAPHAADRIIAMAEQETSHRHNIEQAIVDNEFKEARMGQICALAIGSLAIISGAIISISGAPWAGAIIGGSGVVGLVSVFILGRKSS